MIWNNRKPISAHVDERFNACADLMQQFGLTLDELRWNDAVANLESWAILQSEHGFVHVIMARHGAGRPAYPCGGDSDAHDAVRRAISHARENDGWLLGRKDVRAFRSWLAERGATEELTQENYLERKVRYMVDDEGWEHDEAVLVARAELRQTSAQFMVERGEVKYRVWMHKCWYVPGRVDVQSVVDTLIFNTVAVS